MPFPGLPLLPSMANALILTDPVYSIGAGVMVFFVVIGVMLVFDINIDTKVAVGVILLLVGLTLAFFMIRFEDLAAITIGLAVALGGKEIIERMSWL